MGDKTSGYQHPTAYLIRGLGVTLEGRKEGIFILVISEAPLGTNKHQSQGKPSIYLVEAFNPFHLSKHGQ